MMRYTRKVLFTLAMPIGEGAFRRWTPTHGGRRMNNADRQKNRNVAKRCRYSIEKDWPGHQAVLDRRQCRNTTKHPSGLCWVHR